MNDDKRKKDLVERYIYDVTRRLHENERDEVKRELKANISDMLPDKPNDQDVIDVLVQLGNPRILAEQYRQKPRYLISPAIFELYISVLKIAVLIVGLVCLCIGIVIAVFSSGSLPESIGEAISMGIEGALQAAFWVTAGFVVYERCSSEKTGSKDKPWTVNDLPGLPEKTEVNISRSSSAVEMILAVFFPVLIIMMILRNELFFAITKGTELIVPFTHAALERMIPYLIVFGVLGFVMGILKLVWGRWNTRLCAANIIQNIVWLSLILNILCWPDLLSEEIKAFAYKTFADDAAVLGFLQTGRIFIFFAVVFVAGALIDIITSIYKTWKGKREAA